MEGELIKFYFLLLDFQISFELLYCYVRATTNGLIRIQQNHQGRF